MMRTMQAIAGAAVALDRAWSLARAGELKAAADVARSLLASDAPAPAGVRTELHLVCAFCAMRQGDHAAALADLERADRVARAATGPRAALRVEAWRAELAYFQGRYTDASRIVERLLPALERDGDRAYAAFALRVAIAVLLARRDYEAIAALAGRALDHAQASGDDYVLVQVLNILGAVHFDRATTKLMQPHARAHLSSLDLADAAPMEQDARAALECFEHARTAAQRAGLEFAAWYVAGNIERLEILLGHADRAVPAIRARLATLQARGARYDEIVTRSNLAWGLRLLGRHREALEELDAALALARETRTANVLLEFLEYDRSIVLDALGHDAAARASYRRYLAMAGSPGRAGPAPAGTRANPPAQALEPYFLKRADRFMRENLGRRFTVAEIANCCGVSLRTLEKAFSGYRGVTLVAHVRNLRLDAAHLALAQSDAPVAVVAARCGFGSSTTFALEYRKRFGMSPTRARRVR